MENVKFSSGLAPVIGYEPWALRAIDSARISIAKGIPLLVRLHPAADYPCDNEETYYKQDMEGHTVLLVGYDDDKRMFDVVDPWRGKGECGGIKQLPYEIMPLRVMNASADKATHIATPDVRIFIGNSLGENNDKTLNISVGYYLPRGYVIDRKQSSLSNVIARIKYKIGSEEYISEVAINGSCCVGERIETTVPLEKGLSGNVHFEVEIICTLSGKRPYEYSDPLCFKLDKEILINAESVEYEIIRFRIAA